MLREAAEEKQPFALALIDMGMPDETGLELGVRIKDDPVIAETRLVLMTTQGARGDAQMARQAGFHGYLTKPILQSDLYDALLQVAGTDAPDRLITRHTAQEQPQFSGRILVVEDNATNQRVAAGMLRKFGVEIDLADNGRQALERLHDVRYDLVFMDCQMPEMDGYEAARRIREPASGVLDRRIPIIALTAHAMAEDVKKCLEAGMDDHISKPVSLAKFRRALGRWLTEAAETLDGQTSPDRVPSVSSAQAPVFDVEQLRSLLEGDEQLLHEIVDGFLSDLPVQLDALTSALDKDALPKAAELAHAIKGAAANVGAMRLSELAAEIEQSAKCGESGQVKAILEELRRQHSQFASQAQAALPAGESSGAGPIP